VTIFDYFRDLIVVQSNQLIILEMVLMEGFLYLNYYLNAELKLMLLIVELMMILMRDQRMLMSFVVFVVMLVMLILINYLNVVFVVMNGSLDDKICIYYYV